MTNNMKSTLFKKRSNQKKESDDAVPSQTVRSRNDYQFNAEENKKEKTKQVTRTRIRSSGHTHGPPTLVALYDFEKRQDDELSFDKGDELQLMAHPENGAWLMSRNMRTRRTGFAPKNFLSEYNESPESQEWWFAIDRQEAERLLQRSEISPGMFLIRSSKDVKSYALSVRLETTEDPQPVIKHYRIRIDNSDCKTGAVEEYFITSENKFLSITSLIQFYKGRRNGLCCLLTEPCPRPSQVTPFRMLEVDRTKIKLDSKPLGSGNFGEVYRGIRVWAGNIEVAVKIMKLGMMDSDDFLKEAAIMHQLSHPKLVQLMGVCTNEEPFYIITELMCNGALNTFLTKSSYRLKFFQLISMAAQICSGMEYLEVKNLCHRDLRAANVLVGENLIVKVADFGLARILDQSRVYNGGRDCRFPVKWTAPEAIKHHRFSVKSDVWSFGILLHEILTHGDKPYGEMSNHAVEELTCRGGTMPYEDRYTRTIYRDVMMRCWALNPHERISFKQLSEFFDDFDSRNLT